MDFDRLFNDKKLPLKYYNQLNGRSIQDNYYLIKKEHMFKELNNVT